MRLPLKVTALAISCALVAGKAAGDRSERPEIEIQLSVGPGGMTITPRGGFVISLHQYYGVEDRVIEVSPKGEIGRFPDDTIGRGLRGGSVMLDAVQGLVADAAGRVWMLDNGRRGESIPKVVAWDTKDNKLFRTFYLPEPATLDTSYLREIALNPDAPYAYLTDPASGGDAALIVLNRETGAARRVLQGHFSVVPDESLDLLVEGSRFEARKADGTTIQPQVGAGPVAVDRKGDWLYFGPLKGRTLFRIATSDLHDTSLRPIELASRVEGYAEKSICSSISIDSKNNIYVADLTNNAIGIITEKDRLYRSYLSDPRFLWPDGLCFGVDGRLYFFTSQLHRSAALNGGDDYTRPPFYVFSIKALASGTVGR
ncbi:L-dopachrome tautomerase-related protein [soil metagenome]